MGVTALAVASALVVSSVAASTPTVEIVPNVEMPLVGLGTWLYNDTEAEAAVAAALKVGYTLIDTAAMYNNQRGVGRAIRASGIPRSDLFVATKIPGGLTTEEAIKAVDQNLVELDMDYADVILTHFPCDFNQTKCSREWRQSTWKGLEAAVKSGKARAIGVSHFCQHHLDDVLAIATVPIALNQEEWHVGMGTDPQGVKSYGDKHGVLFQSFSPLCGPCNTTELINGPVVTKIGKKYNKDGVQISLKWLLSQERPAPVIPRTNNPIHLKENLDLFDFELSKEDLDELNAAVKPASVETVAADCKIKDVFGGFMTEVVV